MTSYTARPQKPEATDTDRTNPDNTLDLAATGAGSLVFEQLTEDHDGTTVTTGKRLLGYMHVTDWSAIRDAVRARGHGTGAVLHLPEFDTIEGAHEAATEAAR